MEQTIRANHILDQEKEILKEMSKGKFLVEILTYPRIAKSTQIECLNFAQSHPKDQPSQFNQYPTKDINVMIDLYQYFKKIVR